ncbi:diacylglycerol kinase family protein [Desulfuromonas sp. AOP6]|uniref:diacylglycerol/lipid kinase family protein n=1 Tax=Desulfuromonas sp. AOP6 TaxID=1566351 RepID=UPI001BCEAE62|nr:diacylglycerol kinase family protein [Desulfuromonas sp. AOP6]
MNKTIKLIANPVAGRQAVPRIEQARAYFEGRGFAVDLTLTQARGDATLAARQARNGGYCRVVAAGGDGTLNEVVNGLAPAEVPLGFLPLGTTNVFALEVGIPFEVEKACAAVLEGEARPVCLGKAGESRFLLMAGIGFDAEAVCRVSSRLKRQLGKLAYVISALQVWLDTPAREIQVELEDGSRQTCYGVILCNARYYGGRFVLAPAAGLENGHLEACLFLKGGRLAQLAYALRIGLHLPLKAPGVRIVQTRRLTLSGDRVAVQLDGDCAGRLPLTVEALPGELNLMFPRLS